jgi:hypothetical protein
MVHSSESPTRLRILASALAHLGRMEEARKAIKRLQQIDPDVTVRKVAGFFTADTPGIRRYLDGMRMAGLPYSF